MRDVSRSSEPHTEPKVEPDYFAYYTREIEDLFSQRENFISSLSSNNSVSLAKTHAKVKDDGIDDNRNESNEALSPSPSLSRTLFCNGIEDGLSVFKKERLRTSLKQSVSAFGQEVEEMLDSVLTLQKVKKHIEDKENAAKNPTSCESDVRQSPCKKQKLSSPSSTGFATRAGRFGSPSCGGASVSEDKDNKDHDVVSSEDSQSIGLEKMCLECKTTKTPQWREGPAGPKTLCNACGIRNKKNRMSPLGVNKVEKELKQEFDEDFWFILDKAGSHAKGMLEIYYDEFLAKLGHMEAQLDKYLDVVMSNCREMTKAEKQELGKLIQNLPPKNLDRVVDLIVQHRKLPEGHPCKEIHIDLEKEDNVTLWRVYYYVKTVESAKSMT